MDLPSVSCICPTYGRFALLEEAVESFLRQDYQGDRELIVVNDLDQQTLVFDHPLVQVINLPERCRSLGNKRNAATAYASNRLLLTWGDDDIHLPWRISRMVRAYQRHRKPACMEGPHYIFHGNVFHLKPHSTTGALLVEREWFYRVDGIPEMNSGEDSALLGRLKAHASVAICDELPPGFIYRWSSPRFHISAFGADKPGQPSGWERAEESVLRAIARGDEPVGELLLNPRWKQDYIAAVQGLQVEEKKP